MSSYPIVPLGSRFEEARNSMASDNDTFLQALPESLIKEAAAQENIDLDESDATIYTPARTLWTYISQVLSSAGTCVAGVSRLIVLMVTMGLTPCSSNTGAYCKARVKLSLGLLRRLTYQIGEETEDAAPEHWRCLGRRAILLDGFVTTADDTPANQKTYPQPRSQKPGLGFPMIRVVVLLTFATACLIGAAWGKHKGKGSGEPALFRSLMDQLRVGDLVVADRYYCSYWIIAMLQAKRIDVVFRLHQKRDYDFRRGQRLGERDHVVTWYRPARPDWMTEEQYTEMPETLTIRELQFRIDEPGSRSEKIVVATTILDEKFCSKEEIAEIYHKRWHVELDIRSIKQTMKLNHISCKSPEMIDKHIMVTLLSYNLIRKVMALAAIERGLSPRQLSFASARQIIEAFGSSVASMGSVPSDVYVRAMLRAIATHKVGNRPGRVEPRCFKRRRDNKYKPLRKPRAEARAELLN